MEESEIVLRIATIANEAKDPEATLHACLEMLCQNLNWTLGHLYVVSSETEAIESSSIWVSTNNGNGLDEFRKISNHTKFKEGVGIPGKVLASKEAVWITDIKSRDDFVRRDIAIQTGITSCLAFPVIVREEVLAVVELFSMERKDPDPILENLIIHIGMQIGRVIERQRAEVALLEIQKDLERSNKDLEQFAYIASHDLREPLREVTSYAQLLKKKYSEAFDEQGQKYLKYITGATFRMEDMIKALLTYSRAGRTKIEEKPVLMSNLVDEVLHVLSKPIRETSTKVHVDELPEVVGNELLLLQVIQNLISNSIKFRDEKPLEIHVSADEDSEGWTFKVKDNGMGIKPEDKDRIFALFQRGTTLKKIEGTGIGLAITKRIIERHGGKIWYESTPGKETTFFFRIPKKLSVMEVEHERTESGSLFT